MVEVLPIELYNRISLHILNSLGLNFPADRKTDLERALRSAAESLKFNSLLNFVEWWLDNKPTKEELESIIDNLTIGETYFFRERKVFDILFSTIIPRIMEKKKNKELRIWSAGCCTGEEPYTLAMMFEMYESKFYDWNISILATDVNNRFLVKAREGVYNEWSFRNVENKIKEDFFEKISSVKYLIKNSIKNKVEFEFLNLIEDTFPSLLNKTNSMDVILCRNVLLYFADDGRKKVLNKFYDALNYNGWFISGLTELSYLSDNKFSTEKINDLMFFTKTEVKNFNYQNNEKKNNLTVERITEVKPSIKKEIKKSFYSFFRRNGEVKKSEKDEIDIIKCKAAFENRNYDYVISKLKESLANKKFAEKDKEEIYVLLIKSYANTGNVDSALKWAEEGIAKFKLSYLLYILYANLLHEKNKINEAVEALFKAVYLNPEYVVGHFTLATLLIKIKREKEAERSLETALKILNKKNNNSIVEDSEGITVETFKNIITTMLMKNEKQ